MSAGVASKLGIHTANPTTVAYSFESENLASAGTIIDTSGISGSRSHYVERTRTGPYTVGGSIEMFPTKAELDLLLPWILGATEITDVFALAETLTSRFIQVDRVAKVMTYAGCYVNRATFSSRQGEAMRMVLDVIGQTETVGAAASFPAISATQNKPYVMTDGTLTLLSSSRSFKDFTIVVDNHLEVAFNQSLTASTILATDRSVGCSFTTPYTSSEIDLYNQALAGAAASLILATGTNTLTFTFATLQFPHETPVVAGKGEIPLRLNGMARQLSTTKELVVTNA